MSFSLKFVKPPKRNLVKEPEKLLEYLERGGNANAVPIFKDERQEFWMRTCCFPCWLMNDSNLTFLDEECSHAEATYGDELTLLHWAVIYGVAASVRMLIEHGADVECLTLDKQFSPIQIAVRLKTLSPEDMEFLYRARAAQFLKEKAAVAEKKRAKRSMSSRLRFGPSPLGGKKSSKRSERSDSTDEGGS